MKRILLTALMLAIAVAGFSSHGEARDDKKDRVRFYGWVESMPEGLLGTWIIGGQTVVASPGTEFDEVDGPLTVGGCAKVDIRGGAVHEIDSEPHHDCQRPDP
ncbi:MAG: hypothetical protein R2940_15075 [Syntrophotaleaceae bacterium]